MYVYVCVCVDVCMCVYVCVTDGSQSFVSPKETRINTGEVGSSMYGLYLRLSAY